MRVKLFALAVVACTVAIAAPASAQTQIGAHAGFDFDSSELYIGPNAVIPLPWTIGEAQLRLNPEFLYYFVKDCDGCSFWMLSVNVLYPFEVDFGDLYAGGGLAYSVFSYDFDSFGALSKSGAIQESSSDFGVNFKAGVNLGQGKGRPFGEAGFFIVDSSWLYIQGGFRYTLGG